MICPEFLVFVYSSLLIRAEAEQMRMKAAAYAQYGDAAVMSLVLEALPKVG